MPLNFAMVMLYETCCDMTVLKNNDWVFFFEWHCSFMQSAADSDQTIIVEERVQLV